MPTTQRVQVGDLSGPDQIRPQSVLPDTYSRPYRDTSAGSALGELADALGSTRPGVAAISKAVYNDYQDTEFVSGQQFRQYVKDTNKVDKSGWSRARLQGYEMADAQITASKLPFAYEQALKDNGLWDNPSANPQDVEKAFSEVRAQYAAKGEGTSPVWAKTFEQYRQGFENGVMNRWLQNASQIREVQQIDSLTAHAAEQIGGAVQLQDVNEANSKLHEYLDSSFMDISTDAPKFNRAVAKAFESAYSTALDKNDFTSADRIREMAANYQTKEGYKMSDTDYGTQVLGKMDYDRHNAVRNYQELQQVAKQQARQQLESAQWEFIKPFIGKPATEWPTDLPKSFYDSAGPLGFADDFRSNYLKWRDSYNKAGPKDLQVTQSLVELDRDAVLAGSTEELANVQKRALELGPSVTNQSDLQILKSIVSTHEAKVKLDGDNGMFRNPAYNEGRSNFDRYINQSLSSLKGELRNAYRKGEAGEFKFKLPLGVQIDVQDDGKVDFFMPDVELDMKTSYSNRLKSMAQEKGGWDKLTVDDFNKATKAVSEEFKPILDDRSKTIRESIKQQSNAFTPSGPTGLSPSGTPNLLAVNKVISSQSSMEWLGNSLVGDFASGEGLVKPRWRAVSQSFDTYKQAQNNPEEVLKLYQLHSLIGTAPREQLRNFAENLVVSDARKDRSDMASTLTQIETPAFKKSISEFFKTGKSDGINRNTLISWATIRKHFSESASSVPMSLDETLSTDPAWITTEGIPFPSDVIVLGSPEAHTDESLMKLKKHFGLNDDQLRLFIKTQQKLIESRSK